MKYASAMRPLFAFAIVLSPFIVIACSEPASHPPIVGECVGANCPPGQGQASTSGSGGGGSGGDGSTTSGGDGSTGTGDGSTGVGDSGSPIGSE